MARACTSFTPQPCLANGVLSLTSFVAQFPALHSRIHHNCSEISEQQGEDGVQSPIKITHRYCCTSVSPSVHGWALFKLTRLTRYQDSNCGSRTRPDRQYDEPLAPPFSNFFLCASPAAKTPFTLSQSAVEPWTTIFAYTLAQPPYRNIDRLRPRLSLLAASRGLISLPPS